MRCRNILIVVFTAAFWFIGASTVARLQPQNKQSVQNENGADHERVREAIRRGGYREAAKLKGRYIETIDPNWDWANFNLETLTKNSVGVIIGIPQSEKGKLSATGESINTEYEVKIEKIIKGNFLTDSMIKVSLPGGKVEFEDGTSAELQTIGVERIGKNKRYVLFLYQNANGSNELLLTGGPQGLFELTEGRQVKAYARETDAVTEEVKGLAAPQFLQLLLNYSQRWPETRSCCL